MYAALLDELRKIAASRSRMTVAKSRSGRRPMRVDTMLRKEKDGSLFKESEVLPGGRAAGKSPSDFPFATLRKGQNVELEHTKDRKLAREVAMDHLTEDPRYYDKLEKMEKKAAPPASIFPVYSDGVERQVGKPARAKRKPGDVPSKDDPTNYPKTEQSQTNQSTTALVPSIGGAGYY